MPNTGYTLQTIYVTDHPNSGREKINYNFEHLRNTIDNLTIASSSGSTSVTSGDNTSVTLTYLSGAPSYSVSVVADPIFSSLTSSTIYIGSQDITSNLTGTPVFVSGSSGIFSIKANNNSTTNALGDYSYAEGFNTTAISLYSHSEGYSTTSRGGHAEGYNTYSHGTGAHAEGYYTKAEALGAHAEGQYTSSDGGHAEGYGTYSQNGHAEGNYSTSLRGGSHAEGSTTLASGYNSHAEGEHTTSIGNDSHAEGYYTTSLGDVSHSEGNQTTSIGIYSHSQGNYTNSIGDNSHAEGYQSWSIGNSSHAEGGDSINGISGSTSIGISSHAEGIQTTSSGYTSHAEGYQSTSVGSYSHTEGLASTSIGVSSHAEGINSVSSGDTSHAEGSSTTTFGPGSHSEGESTTAAGEASHAEGSASVSNGIASHSEGYSSTANSDSSHAEGFYTKALASYSHTEGAGTTTLGVSSHAEGDSTTAIGATSHSEGSKTTSIGTSSHSEGSGNISYGYSSHSEGGNTQSFGNFSHSEGYGSTSGGHSSHSEGYRNISSDDYSHSEGIFTTAYGISSHSEGSGTTAYGTSSHAGGIISIASGITSFVHGSGSTAGGNGTIVLGNNLTGLTDNTTYLANLNINTIGSSSSIINLGLDSFGNVVSGSSSTNLGNIVFVTSNGNDSTGVRGNLNKPFKSLQAARNAAISGDTVYVFPQTFIFDNTTGAYNSNLNDLNMWKNGITYYWCPGTKVKISNVISNTLNTIYFFRPLASTGETCTTIGSLEYEQTTTGGAPAYGAIYYFFDTQNTGGYEFYSQTKSQIGYSNEIVNVARDTIVLTGASATTTCKVTIISDYERVIHAPQMAGTGAGNYVSGGDNILIFNSYVKERYYGAVYCFGCRYNFTRSTVNFFGETMYATYGNGENFTKLLDLRFASGNINIDIKKTYLAESTSNTNTPGIYARVGNDGALGGAIVTYKGDIYETSTVGSALPLFKIDSTSNAIYFYGNIYTNTGSSGRIISSVAGASTVNINGDINYNGTGTTTQTIFYSNNASAVTNFNGSIKGNFAAPLTQNLNGIVNINNSNIVSKINGSSSSLFTNGGSTLSYVNFYNSYIELINNTSATSNGNYIKVKIGNSTISNLGSGGTLYNSSSNGSLSIVNSAVYSNSGTSINYLSAPVTSFGTVTNSSNSITTLNGSIAVLPELL